MRWLKPLLNDFDQKLGAEHNSDLRLHRFLVGTEKVLDTQMLIDLLEAEFDLPSLPLLTRARIAEAPYADARKKPKAHSSMLKSRPESFAHFANSIINL